MKKLFLLKMSIPFLIFFYGCGNTVNEKTVNEENSESKEFVEITEAQMNAVEIKLGRFEKRNLRTSIKVNGILELPPQNKANVGTMLGGTVKNILITEGDFVKEGEILALLEHPQFIDIQQEYLETLNKFEFLSQEYERKKKLYNENISSGKEYQQVEAEYKTTKSKLLSLKAKLQLLELNINEIENGNIATSIPIKAPIHGYVRKVEVNIGSYAEPQKDMFEIVDNHHIHIDLLVYENDINKIKKGQKVNFSVSNLGDKELHAKIFAVGKAFENDVKAVKIHAEIQNQDNELIPGMYVDGRIIVDNYEANSLPESAIIRDGETSFIFIKTGDQHKLGDDNEEENHKGNEEHIEGITFRKIQVKTGSIDNGFIEVLPIAEIPIDAEIVIYGAYYLDSEMNKGEAEHNH